MQIKILYEDSDILVIDKPSGLMVHSDGKTKEKTITDWILEKYPKLKEVGESVFYNSNEILRPGIVHRLDKETSGVLLIMKTKEAFDFFKKQFMIHEIKKTYIAIVSGYIKNEKGKIDKPIGRSPSDFRRRLAGRGARGELREAVTEYKVLKRFEDEEGNKFTYLEIYPKTGRTHQIRVHLKYLSYPIVCDTLYAPKNYCPSKIARLALHAQSVEFKKMNGDVLKIESPVPPSFVDIFS